MGDLADAVNDLAALLEASVLRRQGLRHPAHSRSIGPARRKVERLLRSYFQRQLHAVLSELKPKLAARLDIIRESFRITAHEASGSGHLFAHQILPTSIAPLRMAVTSVETSEYNDAMRDAILGAAATVAKDLKAGKIAADDVASRWLRDNSLTKLVGDFSATSINRLRDAIADAWDAGGSFEGIVAAIRSTFEDFSAKRAEMIAQTEVNDAYNHGRMATAVHAGFDEKAWDPDGEACELCMTNVDAGWIPIDEDFPSGDPAPTAHPNCDCSIDFQKGFVGVK